MAIRPFKSIQCTDRILNQVQDALNNTLDDVCRQPIMNANVLKRVAIVPGPNTLSHGLGRAYVSFFVGRLSAVCNFVESPNQPDVTKYLIVIADAPCTADFLVL